jgi:hypothetical protein
MLSIIPIPASQYVYKETSFLFTGVLTLFIIYALSLRKAT